MAITETAQRNHERLFPGRKSTLLKTDPELIEVFDNFAFDELLADHQIDERLRLLLILASLIAQQALSEYRVMIEAALTVGVSPVEIKEVLYQAIPYIGIGKAYDFLHATNDVLREHDVELPLPAQSTTNPSTRHNAGRAVTLAIFGEVIERMIENTPEDQQHIQDYIASFGFGDFYSRTGLDLATRELVTLSILLSMGDCEPQLKAHTRGNLNVGNDRRLLIDVITQLLPYVGFPRTLNALRCLDEVEPSKL